MKQLVLSVLFLCSVTTLSAQTIWGWPVDNPQITQVYACRDCAGLTSSRYLAGINLHTGIDLYSANYVPANFNTPVRAVADGTIVQMVPVGSSHGLGNVVVIGHPSGLYSLYGHLDSFANGLSVGSSIVRSQQVGTMGNSGDTQHDSFGAHLHFEIKTVGVIGNPAGSDPFWGYTPGHPDQYGYLDPRTIISNMTTEYMTPTVVQNPPPGTLKVRSAPGSTYAFNATTSVNEQIGENQMYVATRRMWAENRYWYYIDLPTQNSPVDGAETNQGPNGGWIADLAVQTTGSRVQSTTDALRVRSGPSTSYTALGKVYNAEKFVVAGASVYGAGCTAPWYKIYIPGDNNVTFSGAAQGWLCGDYVTYTP